MSRTPYRLRSFVPFARFAIAAALAFTAGSAAAIPADAGRSSAYQAATAALDAERWGDAAERFAAIAAAKSAEADAALYWKAYAEMKIGRRAEARQSVRQLRAQYPESAWLDDAEALALDAGLPVPPPPAPVSAVPPVPPAPGVAPLPPTPPRGGIRGGVRRADVDDPELTDDEELQLYALDGLLAMNSDRALPILQKILASEKPLKIKQRALFILGQSDSPEARAALVAAAKNGRPPGLQQEAIRSLGIAGDKADIAALSDIYSSVASSEVRASVLEAFMIAGEKDPILAAARNEADTATRGKAVEMLGVLGATDELAALYGAPGAAASREKILEALMIAGDEKRILDLARRESDPRLRSKSIEMLGVMGRSDDLVELYRGNTDRAQKVKIIEGLMIAGNGKALIGLLRSETDTGLKKEIVQKLTIMGDDEATDELLRLLGEKP